MITVKAGESLYWGTGPITYWNIAQWYVKYIDITTTPTEELIYVARMYLEYSTIY